MGHQVSAALEKVRRQRVVEQVRVAAHQRSRESDESPAGPRQNAKSIALRRVPGQLVQFVRDGQVEPAFHGAANELDRRHALDLRPARLPHRREQRRSVLRPLYLFADLQLIEIHSRAAPAFRILNGTARIRVDHTTEFRHFAVRKACRQKYDSLPCPWE